MRVFASANKFDDYWLVLMFSYVEEADWSSTSKYEQIVRL